MRNILVGFMLLCTCMRAHAANDEFQKFHGSWAGSGTMVDYLGKKDPITCTNLYERALKTRALVISISCTSIQLSLTLEAKIEQPTENGGVTGSWTEKKLGHAGRLNGTAHTGAISVQIEGDFIESVLVITTRGDAQSILFTPQNRMINGVTMNLVREKQ